MLEPSLEYSSYSDQVDKVGFIIFPSPTTGLKYKILFL